MRWWPAGVALATGLLVLGPALGPGVVLSYDLAWSPDPRLTPFSLGLDTPAPRAVPSDAAGVLLGTVLSGAVAQKVVLLAILVLAGLGAAALLRHWRPAAGPVAACVATVAAIWNPFVAERLVIGQWTVLLGYAVLPWVVRAALRVRGSAGTRPPGAVPALCGWGVLAGLGGANSVVLVAPVAAMLLLVPSPRWRPLGAWTATCVGIGAAWWLPSVVRGPRGANAGFVEFAARSDTALGLVGSLLGGSGMWNPASVPPERGSVVLATVSAGLAVVGVAVVGVTGLVGWGPVLAPRHRDTDERGPALAADGRAARLRPELVVAVLALAGLVAAVMSAVPGASAGWQVLAHLPGGGVLRDSQKLVALWVVVAAVGLGVVADRMFRRGAAGVGVALALGLALPLVLPSLAWGVHGRLASTQVPEDLSAGARAVSVLPQGQVALLPWRQYRRYEWNDGRVSLSLVPRMIAQRVLYDDSLPLRTGRVPGEDARAAAVTKAIDSGTDEWSAVAHAGPRYVVQEKQTGLASPPPPAGYGVVLLDTPHLRVVDRGETASISGAPKDARWWALVLGWGVSLVTVAAWSWSTTRQRLRRFTRR